jgi:tetratricopeptide (TPR) repeat protein
MRRFVSPPPARGANIRRAMTTNARAAIATALLLFLPLGARAWAEPGTPVENLELKTISGGKEKLLSAKARANLIIFFRTGQDRSVDALAQLATCEKAFAGKAVHWVGVVSSSEDPAAVQSMVAQAGIGFPVVIDQDDKLYDKLGIRLHPMVGIIDGKFRVESMEMYRQIDYCEIIKARIRWLLGELDKAGLEAVLDPPKSTMPGDDIRDVARRDVNLGRRQLKIKQYDKALSSARKALEKAPSAAAFALIGDVYAAQGHCPNALKQYEQALKLDPADRTALAGQQRCAGK